MRFSISRGGKFRARSRRVSWSNRGGARVRVARGVTVGRSGVRVSRRVGPVAVSAGKTGVRAAVTGKAGPVYYGVNGSGPYVGVTAGVGGAKAPRRPRRDPAEDRRAQALGAAWSAELGTMERAARATRGRAFPGE